MGSARERRTKPPAAQAMNCMARGNYSNDRKKGKQGKRKGIKEIKTKETVKENRKSSEKKKNGNVKGKAGK